VAFDRDFVWGTATSSYQIEGAPKEDGKGPSIWDALCAVPGAIADASTGDVACDHYHRVKEDVQLMRRLGVDAYRFSISWPRVLPEGVGAVNQRGLAFYDRLVDRLLEAGIIPYITLYHWDFPLALHHRGGWLNRDSAQWFADFATVIAERLSDRVTNWITINEPQCSVGLGYSEGRHAPGLKLSNRDVLLVGHHTLLAHGRAVQAIRAAAKTAPQIGWASVNHVQYPATQTPADIEAARAAYIAVDPKAWFWSIAWFADAIHLGAYPEKAMAHFGKDAPVPQAGDMETISTPVDFLGLNIYSGTPHARGEDGAPRAVPHPHGMAHTDMGWAVAPESLRWGPTFAAERYRVPIFITENGMANLDWLASDGAVHDHQRIDYLKRYLDQLEIAAGNGVPIRGYFEWSLLDNFEWAEGYTKRFGLVHVDFATGERTPKASFQWYADRIRAARSVPATRTTVGT
jgi:beta-glucosidase